MLVWLQSFWFTAPAGPRQGEATQLKYQFILSTLHESIEMTLTTPAS